MTKKYGLSDNIDNGDFDEYYDPRIAEIIRKETEYDNRMHNLIEMKMKMKDYVNHEVIPLLERFDFADWDIFFKY